jgi:hypothetical protein
MSILDIDLETNIMDFSKHDRNGRIYDPDCAKIPDEYSIPVEVAEYMINYLRLEILTKFIL